MYKLIFKENEVEKEIELNNTEFKVLSLAVNHNRGMINLLSEKQAIQKLFTVGLVTFNNDDLLKVKDDFQGLFRLYHSKSILDTIQGTCIDNITLIEE